jgi:Zn-dependent M28 family amino/carboxypeptidase
VRAGLPVLICALLVAAGCGGSDSDDAGAPDTFDGVRAMRDVRAQVAIGPRPSGSSGARDEVALIVRSLRAAGVEDVGVQGPERNVVGVIPGSEPGAVVVGAHYDTKDAIPGFVGANDGASGVAVVLELARALPARLDGPSIHLALFDAEEARGDRPFERDGTRGSAQYVAYARAGGRQGSPPLNQIHAMVLFDMVGDCDLQLPREATSDRTLYGAFADAARERSGTTAPFEGGTGGGVLDDHTPFLQAGVPALDLIDFTYGPGPPPGAWWHTDEDTIDKICADSLDAIGEAAAVAIPRIR